MFATLAGGYPFGPLPGAVDGFDGVRERWARGGIAPDAFTDAVDAHVAAVAAEQAKAGLDLVEDALAGFPGHGIDGLAAALLAGSVTAEALVDAWRRLDAASGLPTKAVIPGPACLAGAREPSTGRSDVHRDIEVVRDCLDALATAGCAMVLLVEPTLARPGIDPAAWPAVGAAHEAACRDQADRIHLCLSIPGGAPDQAGIAALVAGPFASYHVDITAGPAAWRYVGALPPERGVIVGVVRADSAALDDEEVLVWAATLAAERDGRGAARVGIAPSASLAGIDRHRARRKIERLGSAVGLARMGPIGQVARTLQPDPAVAAIPALRQLITDHDAVLDRSP